MLEIRSISVKTVTCLFAMFSLWSVESTRCTGFELLRHRFQMYPDKVSTGIHLAGVFKFIYSGERFQIYLLWRAFSNLSTLESVFKFIYSGERFQIYPFSVGENAVYMWTEHVTV